MKRSLAVLILGAVAALHETAFGQGALRFSNYQSPYVPIQWWGDGSLVGPSDGVRIELWWGDGEISDPYSPRLVFADVVRWSAFDGYTDPSQVFVIPWYRSGDTWTFQLRAYSTGTFVPGDFWWIPGPGQFWAPSGMLLGVGPMVATREIGNLGAMPPELPTFVYTPGFQIGVLIPEPSAFSLLGCGAAALLVHRKRCRGANVQSSEG